MVEGMRVLLEVVFEIEILQPPREQRIHLLLLICAPDGLLVLRVGQVLARGLDVVPHQVVVIGNRLSLLEVVELEDGHELLVSEEEFDVVCAVYSLLQSESPLKDLIDHCLWKVHHLGVLLLDKEVYFLSAYLEASIEEVVPDVLGLYLRLAEVPLGLQGVFVFLLGGILFQLVLAAEQLGIGVFDEGHDVLLAQTRDDVLVDALLLELVELEKVSEPEDVLHEVNVFAFLFFVSTCPKHFICVHKVKYDSEGLGCGPEREQNPYLLGVVDAVHDVPELL